MRTEKIELQYPVTVAGQKYSSLTMRAPKVRDMLASEVAGQNLAQKEVGLFVNLCEVPREVVEELEMADYAKLQGVYTGFLSSPPPTPAGDA